MFKFEAYGFSIETDYPITYFLPPCDRPVDLSFTSSTGGWNNHDSYKTVYESSLPGLADEALFSLYEAVDHFKLHYSGTASFYIADRRIHCQLLDPQYHYWIEIAFLGPVMSLWMELNGYVSLHAAGVVRNGEAVGLMAASKSGKTSLAASMMQAGNLLLSDDILPISTIGEVIAHPGYPQMRMWPDQASIFVEDPTPLPLAHPDFDKRRLPAEIIGRFASSPAPLRAVLVPVRTDTVDRLQTSLLSKPRALFTLLQGSFAASVMESMPDMQKQRLSTLSKVVAEVPVYQVQYPSGYDRLPAVRDELLTFIDSI